MTTMKQQVTIRGIGLMVEKHDDFWRAMAAGQWEESTLDAFDEFLPRAGTFVDIGGWIGPTSLYAARHCRRIIAFEPDPAAREEFTRNVALNGLSGIEIRPEAMSAREGAARMWDGGSGQGQSISSLVHGRGTPFSVNTMTPAQLRGLIGPDETYFIKMDIEGGEYDVGSAISPLLGPGLVGALIAFHPSFLGGLGLFRPFRSFPKALAVFRQFRDFDIYRLTATGRRRARVRQMLTRLGLPLFEAKDSYLFIPRQGGMM